jgi:phage gpG-like protein
MAVWPGSSLARKAVQIIVDSKSVGPHLKIKQAQFSLASEKALRDATLLIEGEVKQSIAGRRSEPVSVDTGRLLNSVRGEISKDSGVVGTPVVYAPYIEYGTIHIRERRHFRNTKARNQARVVDLFRRAVATKSDR